MIDIDAIRKRAVWQYRTDSDCLDDRRVLLRYVDALLAAAAKVTAFHPVAEYAPSQNGLSQAIADLRRLLKEKA